MPSLQLCTSLMPFYCAFDWEGEAYFDGFEPVIIWLGGTLEDQITLVLVKKGVIDCSNDTQCDDDRACLDSLRQAGRKLCELPCDRLTFFLQKNLLKFSPHPLRVGGALFSLVVAQWLSIHLANKRSWIPRMTFFLSSSSELCFLKTGHSVRCDTKILTFP